jgi:hypothetical protein
MTSDLPAYEFLDLIPSIRKDLIRWDGYGAGSQLSLLKHALDVEWIVSELRGSYQGTWFGAFAFCGKIVLLNGYYGS